MLPDSASKNRRDSFALPLSFGQSLTIEVSGKSYKTFLRGEKESEFLIVDIPTRGTGIPVSFQKDAKCVVRFMHEGTVFGFAAYMRKEIVNPVHFLILDYPQNIEEFNLRKSERLETFLPVKLVLGNKKEKTKPNSFVIDLSKGGCRIYIDGTASFNVEDKIQLTFPLPPWEPVQDQDGLVKVLHAIEKKFVIAIEFCDVDTQTQKKIDDFVHFVTNVKNVIASDF